MTLDESGRLLWCADVGRLLLLLILYYDFRFNITPSSFYSEFVDFIIESLSNATDANSNDLCELAS